MMTILLQASRWISLRISHPLSSNVVVILCISKESLYPPKGWEMVNANPILFKVSRPYVCHENLRLFTRSKAFEKKRPILNFCRIFSNVIWSIWLVWKATKTLFVTYRVSFKKVVLNRGKLLLGDDNHKWKAICCKKRLWCLQDY